VTSSTQAKSSGGCSKPHAPFTLVSRNLRVRTKARCARSTRARSRFSGDSLRGAPRWRAIPGDTSSRRLQPIFFSFQRTSTHASCALRLPLPSTCCHARAWLPRTTRSHESSAEVDSSSSITCWDHDLPDAEPRTPRRLTAVVSVRRPLQRGLARFCRSCPVTSVSDSTSHDAFHLQVPEGCPRETSGTNAIRDSVPTARSRPARVPSARSNFLRAEARSRSTSAACRFLQRDTTREHCPQIFNPRFNRAGPARKPAQANELVSRGAA